MHAQVGKPSTSIFFGRKPAMILSSIGVRKRGFPEPVAMTRGALRKMVADYQTHTFRLYKQQLMRKTVFK